VHGAVNQSSFPTPIASKTTLLNEGNSEEKRLEVLDYFHKSFDLYESLFECLKDDDAYYTKASPLRHPLILSLAIGVDEMSWDDLNDAHYDWPTPETVKAYRDRTREIVDKFIRTCDVNIPISWDDPLWIVMMGIEHERIHLETSSVLIRELPLDRVQPHPIWSQICTSHGDAPENTLLPVKGKEVLLGKTKDDPLYGWDVEYGEQLETVADFEASQYLVSNGEWLEFMKAGGYETESLWTPEGWSWVQYRKATAPVFWVKDGDKYLYRTMLENIEMPWDWPVDICYLEAKAFCNWKTETTGRYTRMPTEAEWYALRDNLETDQPYWSQAPGNINLEYYASSCPVNRHEFPGGFFDIIGNVWQWTETPVDGYEGYQVHPAYDDFSAPTFDGKHNLFKGGCWISTGNYAIRDARPRMNVYETDIIVAQYIEFHYGADYFDVPNFPVACIAEIAKHLNGKEVERALDIGCATGRSSFELARHAKHVDALDFSARLIVAPSALQKDGIQRYAMQDEGEIVSLKEITLEALGYTDVADRINFMQGDACNLPDKFTDYDVVFAGNLIDRLYEPQTFLDLIKGRIRSGGLLVITSPYTWLEEFTEREKWLGGFKAQTGENYTTLEGIRDALAPEFEPAADPVDVPFVIRETRRKFQHSVAELSVWKKQ